MCSGHIGPLPGFPGSPGFINNDDTEENRANQQGRDHERGPGETAADRTHRPEAVPNVLYVVIPKCSDSSHVTMPRLTVRGGQRA